MQVLIVDDHPIIHETLPLMLEKAAGCDVVVHISHDLQTALESSQKLKLDLVVLDLGLPGVKGIDALRCFREKLPLTTIVVFSACTECATIKSALRIGAAGYIPKTTQPVNIVGALRLVMDGGKYIPAEALKEDAVPDTHLSKRQVEVLQLILAGLSNRQISGRLRIAETTVKQHVGDVYIALNVATRAEAMALALRKGFKPAQ